MSTFTGRAAEDAVAVYLAKNGYEILTQNWRTRWCEIDIVAKKHKIVHFVEVKYRKSATFGSGLDYITPTKTKQLKRAALFWVNEHAWEGDYRLDVASVDGQSGSIELVENAIMG